MLRNQKAIIWCRGGALPNKYGTVLFLIVPVMVRWEWKREEYQDEFGETKVSNSIVYFGDEEYNSGPSQVYGVTTYRSSINNDFYVILPGDHMTLNYPGGVLDTEYENGRNYVHDLQPSEYGDFSKSQSVKAYKIMSVAITPNLSNTKRIIKVWL